MIGRLAFSLIVGAATQVLAEDAFQRPASCVLTATAQYDNCSVDSILSCGAGEAMTYRTETFGAEGLLVVWRYDPATDSAELNDPAGDARYRYAGEDILDAIDTGSAKATYEADIQDGTDWFTVQGNESYRFDGERADLAGRTFHKVAKTGVMSLSGTSWRYITDEVLLYDVEADLLVVQKTVARDQTPPDPGSRLVALSLPGQPGFGAEVPTHGCLTTSSLSIPLPEVPA